MKWISLIVFAFLPFALVAQIQGEDEVYLSNERIEAKFNGGGIEKFNQYVRKEFDFSKARKAGQMKSKFTVDAEGNIKNIRVTQMLDSDSAIEMIRVLNSAPKWEPAKRNGKPIAIDIEYPMSFKTTRKIPENDQTPKPTVAPDGETNPEKESPLNAAGVEVKPEFPGGMAAFYAFVGKNYKVPNVRGLSGKVFVQFVIEKDGSITDITVIRDLGFGTGEEAKRMLLTCPKWIPGMQKGRPVRVQFLMPINIEAKK